MELPPNVVLFAFIRVHTRPPFRPSSLQSPACSTKTPATGANSSGGLLGYRKHQLQALLIPRTPSTLSHPLAPFQAAFCSPISGPRTRRQPLSAPPLDAPIAIRDVFCRWLSLPFLPVSILRIAVRGPWRTVVRAQVVRLADSHLGCRTFALPFLAGVALSWLPRV